MKLVLRRAEGVGGSETVVVAFGLPRDENRQELTSTSAKLNWSSSGGLDYKPPIVDPPRPNGTRKDAVMFTPLLVRCGFILPFLPPLADLPPTECWLPTPDADRTGMVESTALTPEPTAPAAQTRELVQLRRTLQMSPLAGSVLDADPAASAVGTSAASADEAEFVQVLYRVVEASPIEVRSDAAVDRPGPREAPERDSADDAGFLRNVSRQLDELANDREDHRDYETADRLRQLSDQLRRRARTATR